MMQHRDREPCALLTLQLLMPPGNTGQEIASSVFKQ
jgi:hypothetical protein